MKGQPHLIVSLEPLPQGIDCISLCGKEIKKAVWVWQVVERGEMVDRVRTCQKCWAKLRPEDGLEYVYGAVSFRDAQPESEEAA